MREKKVADANVSEIKPVNPSEDAGNYLIKIVTEGEVIKQIVAINSTITIEKLTDRGMAIDLK